MKQERHAVMAASAAERRAKKEALEKERMLTGRQIQQKKEAAAAFKARKLSLTKAHVAHAHECDYVKRLEKAWKHADALVARAEDEYEKHLFIMRGGQRDKGRPATAAADGGAPEAEEDAVSWGTLELERLRAKLLSTKRRAEAAADTYNRVAEKTAQDGLALQRETEEIEYYELVQAGRAPRF